MNERWELLLYGGPLPGGGEQWTATLRSQTGVQISTGSGLTREDAALNAAALAAGLRVLPRVPLVPEPASTRS